MNEEDDRQDCALRLINFIGKPKKWREEASKVLIDHANSLKTVKRELGALIGLSIAILTAIISVLLRGGV